MVIDEFHIRLFYVPGVYPVTMGPRPWAGRLLKLDVPLLPIIERHDLQECESGRASLQ